MEYFKKINIMLLKFQVDIKNLILVLLIVQTCGLIFLYTEIQKFNLIALEESSKLNIITKEIQILKTLSEKHVELLVSENQILNLATENQNTFSNHPVLFISA